MFGIVATLDSLASRRRPTSVHNIDHCMKSQDQSKFWNTIHRYHDYFELKRINQINRKTLLVNVIYLMQQLFSRKRKQNIFSILSNNHCFISTNSWVETGLRAFVAVKKPRSFKPKNITWLSYQLPQHLEFNINELGTLSKSTAHIRCLSVHLFVAIIVKLARIDPENRSL